MTNKADREAFEAEYILPLWIYYDAKTERYAKPKAYNYDSNHEIVCECNSHWDIWQAACDHKDKEIAEIEKEHELFSRSVGFALNESTVTLTNVRRELVALETDNNQLRDLVTEFGCGVVDMFEQMRKGNWVDDNGHLVGMNKQMADLIPIVGKAQQSLATTPNEVKDKT